MSEEEFPSTQWYADTGPLIAQPSCERSQPGSNEVLPSTQWYADVIPPPCPSRDGSGRSLVDDRAQDRSGSQPASNAEPSEEDFPSTQWYADAEPVSVASPRPVQLGTLRITDKAAESHAAEEEFPCTQWYADSDPVQSAAPSSLDSGAEIPPLCTGQPATSCPPDSSIADSHSDQVDQGDLDGVQATQEELQETQWYCELSSELTAPDEHAKKAFVGE